MGWKKPIRWPEQTQLVADVYRVVRGRRTRAGVPVEEIRDALGGRLEDVRDAVEFMLSSRQLFEGPNGLLCKNTRTAQRWAAVKAAAPGVGKLRDALEAHGELVERLAAEDAEVSDGR